MRSTPGRCSAALTSTVASEPPSIGACSTLAYTRPGNRTSMPYTARPSHLPVRSTRCAGRPMTRKADRAFSVHVARWRQGGLLGQLAVMRARPRRVADHAVAHLEFGHRQLPAQRCHAKQPRARRGGGHAQRLPSIGHAGRAAGDVDAEFARELQRHPARAAECERLLPRLAVVGVERQEADKALGAAEDRVVTGLLAAARGPAERRAPRPPASPVRCARPGPSRCDSSPAPRRHLWRS